MAWRWLGHHSDYWQPFSGITSEGDRVVSGDVGPSNTYLLNGRDVGRLNDDQLAAIRCRQIAFVFQSFNLLPRTDAQNNVELPLIYARISGRERRMRAREALALVGLEERMHHRPNELSGGQQQRVAIARAIVSDPAIILADEPTGNLDTKTSTEIMELLERLSDERGMTIVFVTHDPDTAEYCDRIVHLRDGVIVQQVDRQQGRAGQNGRTNRDSPRTQPNTGVEACEAVHDVSPG